MKNVCYAMNLKTIKKLKFNKFNNKNFSYSDSEVYIWISNANPGFRPNAYKNKLTMTNFPRKIDFFDGKGAKEIFVGPSHTGVVTESGELYTFGNGSWGKLGHGDEKSIPNTHPKLVEYFTKNNIKISKVCVGDFHTMALTDDNQVYTWGFAGKKGFLGLYYSDSGALGHGDIQDTFIPRKIKFFEKNNIRVKDIACGTRHSIMLSDQGEVYTWGRGEFGLLGNGDNKDSLLPVKNQFLYMWSQEKPENKIVKIDCADEYSGALTEGGDLYVWGKNNHGQLGIGSGIGIEMTESEKFPVPVIKTTPETKFIDFRCGENGMMIQDQDQTIYKTGWRIDYVPSIFEITRTIKPKIFFAGKSYYSMIDHEGKIYQWGSLFNQSKAEKTDSDMSPIKKDPFENKEILRMDGKYTNCGAIVRNKNLN